MADHSDKIFNGLCVECISDYTEILNQKQSEINKLVEEMKNLRFPHLEITMIAREEVQKLQVENTRDDLLNNIFINKNLKEELKEEIQNVIPPKVPKKIGRPKKVKDPSPPIQYDNEKAEKWDMMEVARLKEALAKQGEYELEWLKRCEEIERPKNNDQNKKDRVELVLKEFPKRTRGRGKGIKTLEKEQAMRETASKCLNVC